MGAPPSRNKSVCAQQGRKQATRSANRLHVCVCTLSPLSPLERQQRQSIPTIKPRWGTDTSCMKTLWFVQVCPKKNYTHIGPLLSLSEHNIFAHGHFKTLTISSLCTLTTVLPILISVGLKRNKLKKHSIYPVVLCGVYSSLDSGLLIVFIMKKALHCLYQSQVSNLLEAVIQMSCNSYWLQIEVVEGHRSYCELISKASLIIFLATRRQKDSKPSCHTTCYHLIKLFIIFK